MLELVMFSCINVSFDIIEYKFVFVRSPCFKCSFCPRRFTTIIYSASFTHITPQIGDLPTSESTQPHIKTKTALILKNSTKKLLQRVKLVTPT